MRPLIWVYTVFSGQSVRIIRVHTVYGCRVIQFNFKWAKLDSINISHTHRRLLKHIQLTNVPNIRLSSDQDNKTILS